MLEYRHMSLQEKLSKISQNLQETKAETEKKSQEKELEPIRSRIKELENQKNQLDLVKGSLELKSGEKTGKGMKEYSKETEEQAKKESTRLDTLIDKNKDALQTMGVENKDQLVENQEFAEEPEVVSYKKAKEETADLKMADSSLKEKLKTLGVNTDEENFSYDSAEKALTEKIQSVEGELLQEKLKTPEGKEEAIEVLSKNLEKNIAQVIFSKDGKTGAEVLSLNRGDSKITISGEKTKFEGWRNAKLLPDEMSVLEKTYGAEVVKEAIRKAYENKIQASFDESDKESKNIDKALKEDLERASPEKGSEANKAFREFQNLANIFKTTLKEKAEELKAKGVDFNPNYVQNYGGDYEKYAMLGEYDTDNQLVEQTMRNSQTYPPRLNFDALKEYTEKRIEQIKELTEDIKKLETQDDINKFTRGENSGIGKAHKNILYTKFDGVKRPQYYANEQSWEQTKVKGLMQFKSYEEAKTYFEKKSLERETTKQKLVQNLETGIEAQQKSKELRKEIETQNFGGGINDVENEVSRIEKNKQEALTLMSELIKLESELPNEEVILNGSEIKVPSVGKQLEQLRKDRETEEQNLKNLKQKISNHESNKPKLFGKDKWEKDLTEFRQEQKDLEEKIRKMSNEDYSALSKKYTFRIPTQQYSAVEKLVSEQKYVQGNSKEIFNNLRTQLNEVISRKAPESVITLNKEYKDLEKKLS
ncbi:MAG: hypothetical protein HYW79_01335 [Parcubacteria group bacterium]|nr:hypothetical protein [Parcubacteria group bacterium]